MGGRKGDKGDTGAAGIGVNAREMRFFSTVTGDGDWEANTDSVTAGPAISNSQHASPRTLEQAAALTYETSLTTSVVTNQRYFTIRVPTSLIVDLVSYRLSLGDSLDEVMFADMVRLGTRGSNTYYSIYVESIPQGKTIQFEQFERFVIDGSRFDIKPLLDSLPIWSGTSAQLAAVTRQPGTLYLITDTA